MKVILADGQARIRNALKLLLLEEPEVEVVGEAAKEEELLSMLAHEMPDVLILDWGFPSARPKDLLEQIKREFQQIRVVVMAKHMVEAREAGDAGAHALIIKTDAPDRLLEHLRSFRRGGQRE